MRISRRQCTALLAGAPLAAQVTQKIPPVGAPIPAPAGATPQQKLEKAYADVHQVSERLSKLGVPMNIEPAFAFHP